MAQKNKLPQVVQDCHDLLIWLIPQLDKFPRNRRFTLGERIESRLLEILELLVAAAYSRNKQAILHKANLRMAVVRHLWRMTHELRVISTKRYAYGAKLLESLGKQIGGWMKSQDAR